MIDKKMKFDQILIVDIESTCWGKNEEKDNEEKDNEEKNEENINEIIEVGITPFSTKYRRSLETRDIIIRPEHSKVSQFCTNLTTLTQDIVDSGISFKEACDILIKDYDSKRRVWGSYGYYDKNQFEYQCKRENVEYPFSSSHLNIKMLFALKYSLRREVGMAKALKLLGIPLIGTHHRGGDDSRNIAKILSRILFN